MSAIKVKPDVNWYAPPRKKRRMQEDETAENNFAGTELPVIKVEIDDDEEEGNTLHHRKQADFISGEGTEIPVVKVEMDDSSEEDNINVQDTKEADLLLQEGAKWPVVKLHMLKLEELGFGSVQDGKDKELPEDQEYEEFIIEVSKAAEVTDEEDSGNDTMASDSTHASRSNESGYVSFTSCVRSEQDLAEDTGKVVTSTFDSDEGSESDTARYWTLSQHPLPTEIDNGEQSSQRKKNSQIWQKGSRRQQKQPKPARNQSCPTEKMVKQNEPQADKRIASKIIVKTTSNIGDKRRYDKQYICYFCDRPKYKLPVHLRHAHSEEPAVIEWLEETDERLKSAKLTKLRNLGNHIRNCRVLEKGQGELLVKYRPKIYADPSSFVPCPNCYGYFARKGLWSHACPLDNKADKKKGNMQKKRKRVHQGVMLLSCPMSSESQVQRLLCTLRHDDVSQCIKSDDLIIKLATKEIQVLNSNKEHVQSQEQAVKAKLRLVGKFLVEVRLVSNNPDSSLSDFIDTARYESVLTAVRNMAGFDCKTLAFSKPNIALKIGSSMKKCAMIVKAEGIKCGDEAMVRQSSEFLEILEMKWTEDFACHNALSMTAITENDQESSCSFDNPSHLQDSVEQAENVDKACVMQGKSHRCASKTKESNKTPAEIALERPYPVSVSKVTNLEKGRGLSTKSSVSETESLGITGFERDQMEWGVLPADISTYSPASSSLTVAKQSNYSRERVDIEEKEQTQKVVEQSCSIEREISEPEKTETNNGVIPKVTVKTTSNGICRKYDKQYMCYFCKKFKCKLPSHFRRVHSDEPAVIDWLKERNLKLKSAKLAKLRNLGNHMQNCQVLRQGEGELLVRYRPSKNADPTKFVYCPKCYGYFSRRFVKKHICPLEEVTHGDKGKQGTGLKQVKNDLKVKEVLSTMKKDDVSWCIESDDLILALARERVEILEENHLKKELREIGRFLMEVRLVSNKPDGSMSDFIDPGWYVSVLTAIRNLAGFDSKTRMFIKPELALKIGYGIRKCAMIVKAGLESGSPEMVRQSTKFLELLEMKWTEDFACNSLDTEMESTETNLGNLPDFDICHLQDHVDQVTSEEGVCMKEGKTPLNTSQINKLEPTETQVISDRLLPVSISKVANLDEEEKLSTKCFANGVNDFGNTEFDLGSVQRIVIPRNVSTHPVLLQQILPTENITQREQRVDMQPEQKSQPVGELSREKEELVEQKQSQENDRVVSQITVKTTNNDERRKFDKQYMCYFCNELKCKLPTHFRRVHSGEPAVIDWLEEKDQRLKSAKLTKLRNLGNHIQNCRVLEKGQGELLVKYRPNTRVDPTNFVPCPHCYGYFVRKSLWSHSCPLDKVKSKAKGKGKLKSKRVKNGAMLLPGSRSSKSKVEELLSGMKIDDVSNCVKSDDLILALARKEVTVVEQDREQDSHLRVKLRQIGRFLLEARSVSNQPYSNLSDFIDPECYNSAVAAIKSLAGFNVMTHSSKLPSLAVKIGHGLRKCALLLKAEGIKSGNDATVKKATAFHHILETRWNKDFACNSLDTVTESTKTDSENLCDGDEFANLHDSVEQLINEDEACLTDGEILLGTTQINQLIPENVCDINDVPNLQDSGEIVINEAEACVRGGRIFPGTTQINQLDTTPTQMISDRQFPVSISKAANVDGEKNFSIKHLSNDTNVHSFTDLGVDSVQRGILSTNSSPHSVSVQQTLPTNQNSQRKQSVKRQQEEQSQSAEKLTCQMFEQKQSQENNRVVSQITVKTTNNDERRKYDKQYICYFCEEPKCKLPTHFRHVHFGEPAVIDWLEEKDQRLKSAKLTKLRNLGNHIQNCRVLEKGKGELLVKYRPNIKVDPTNFVPCPHCYGYFVRKSLWSHSCPLDVVKSKAKGKGKLKSKRVKNGAMLLPGSGSSKSKVEELLSGMKIDDVSNCVKSDDLILALARKEVTVVEQDREQDSHLRIKLRQIGRFLLEARSVSNQPYSNLSDFIDPESYIICVATVKSLAGSNVMTHSSKLSSLAVKIGHGLRKCALLLKAEGIKSGNEATVKKATAFHHILETRWNKDFACNSLDTVTESTKTDSENLCDGDGFANLHDSVEQLINGDEACLTDGETLLGTTQVNQLNPENVCDISDVSNLQDSAEIVINEAEACVTGGRIFLGTTQINQLDTTPTQMISDRQFPVSISKAANVDGEKKLLIKHLSNDTNVHSFTDLGVDSVQRGILSTNSSPHSVSVQQTLPTNQNSQRKQRVNRQQEEQSQSAEKLTCQMFEQKQSQENSRVVSQITVKTTSNDEQRKYDKQYICYFCEEPKCKLPTHFRRVHFGEPAVIDWLEEKDQKLKSAKLTKLRNLGNHIQNCRVLEKGKGELLVKYRPNIRVDPTNFVPCPHCYGYFVRKSLWSHSCPLDIVKSKAKGKEKLKSKRVKNGAMLLPGSRSSRSKVEKLLSGMKNDDVSNCVKSDDLILALARKEVKLVEQDREQHNQLRVKLRQIGRLLLEVRSVSNQSHSNLSDFIDPEWYDSVIASVKNLAGINVKTSCSKLPSLAVKIGHSLRKCALVLKAEGIKSGDDITVKKATKFYEMLETRWNQDTAPHGPHASGEQKDEALLDKQTPDYVTSDQSYVNEEIIEQEEEVNIFEEDCEPLSLLIDANGDALLQELLSNRLNLS